MAPSSPASHRNSQDDGGRTSPGAARGGEWQALKRDLIALLDHVDDQRERATHPEPNPHPGPNTHPGPNSRAEATLAADHQPRLQRKFSRQGTSPGGHMDDERRQEALKSVNAAVERFAHAEQQKVDRQQARFADGRDINPQDELQSAIAEIRAQMQQHAAQWEERQPIAQAAPSTRFEARASYPAAEMPSNPAPKPSEPNYDRADIEDIKTRFADLSRIITGLAQRLEHIEDDARSARADAANVHEISAQVAQLGEVVELLAGAVGERGQVKRLESQIAALAETISHKRSGDIEVLGGRIDEIAQTVERLADLQVQQMGRHSHDAEQDGQQQAATLAAIETSVRAIYERVDAIERNTLLSPEDLDRLTEDLAGIARAFEQGPAPHTDPELFARIEALSAQIDKMQGKGSAQLAVEMKAAVEVMRQALSDTTEPRFAAIEERIAALGVQLEDSERDRQSRQEADQAAYSQTLEKISKQTDNAPGETPAALEAVRVQIEKLTQRMDETGAQLAQISERYAHDERAPAPDMEELASLVAQRTSQEVARNIGRENGLDAQGLAELEARLAALFEDKIPQKKQEELHTLHRGIASVEDKIAKLEAALAQTSRKPAAPPPAPPAPPASPAPLASPAPPAPEYAAPRPSMTRPEKSEPGEKAPDTDPAERGTQEGKREAETFGSEAAALPIRSDAMPLDPLSETPLRADGGQSLAAPEIVQTPPFAASHPSGAGRAARERTNLAHTDLRAIAAQGFGDGARLEDGGHKEPEISAHWGADLDPFDVAQAAEMLAPQFNPDAIDRPSKPRSRLGGDAPTEPESPSRQDERSSVAPDAHNPQVFDRQEPVLEHGSESAPASKAAPKLPPITEKPVDRNAFIKAARRAAMHSEAAKTPTSNSSLIARAFARLEGKAAEPEDVVLASVDVKAEPEMRATTPQATPQPANRPQSSGKSGSALANWVAKVRQRADQIENARIEPDKKKQKGGKPKPSEQTDATTGMTARKRHRGRTGLEVADVTQSPASFDAPAENAARNWAPLSSSRRTLLLAALLVATSVLTLNLVVRRIAEQPRALPQANVSAPASSQSGEAPKADTADPGPAKLGSVNTSAFNPSPMLDPNPTGSIAPQMSITMPQSGKTASAPPRQAMPAPSGGDARLVGLAPEPGSVMPAANPANPAKAGTTAGAVKLELPPQEVGPLALRQAAADGDARAQFEIGAIFTEGSIVSKDLHQAAVWYERSAAQGFAPAQYRLGNLYEQGEGVDKDLELAKLWYMRAAEAGNRMAMHNLASLLAGGALGQPQFPVAVEWFTQAAARGLTDSQFNLGMLYARGLGVRRDLGQAYKWFALAAESGDKDAAKARDEIAKSLDPDTLGKVKVELANWRVAPIDMAANFAPIGTWSNDFDPGRPITEAKVIKRVQLALERIGFDVGTPDGVMGPKTAQAIKKFEAETGMSLSGVVNPRLLAVLGSQPV